MLNVVREVVCVGVRGRVPPPGAAGNDCGKRWGCGIGGGGRVGGEGREGGGW